MSRIEKFGASQNHFRADQNSVPSGRTWRISSNGDPVLLGASAVVSCTSTSFLGVWLDIGRRQLVPAGGLLSSTPQTRGWDIPGGISRQRCLRRMEYGKLGTFETMAGV